MGHEGCEAKIIVFDKKDHGFKNSYDCPGGEGCFLKKIHEKRAIYRKGISGVDVIAMNLSGIRATKITAKFVGPCSKDNN